MHQQCSSRRITKVGLDAALFRLIGEETTICCQSLCALECSRGHNLILVVVNDMWLLLGVPVHLLNNTSVKIVVSIHLLETILKALKQLAGLLSIKGLSPCTCLKWLCAKPWLYSTAEPRFYV